VVNPNRRHLDRQVTGKVCTNEMHILRLDLSDLCKTEQAENVSRISGSRMKESYAETCSSFLFFTSTERVRYALERVLMDRKNYEKANDVTCGRVMVRRGLRGCSWGEREY
jgi:hypothetical protein